jgi:hypothetical protein
MIDDALSSQSSVKFTGSETKVVTADAMAESNESEKEKKVAIRQALEDVDDELGIKHEKKVALIEAGKDTKEKKSEVKANNQTNSTNSTTKADQDKKPKEEDKPKTDDKKT